MMGRDSKRHDDDYRFTCQVCTTAYRTAGDRDRCEAACYDAMERREQERQERDR